MKILKRLVIVAVAGMALAACATDRSSRNDDVNLPAGAATGGNPSIPQLDPTVDR